MEPSAQQVIDELQSMLKTQHESSDDPTAWLGVSLYTLELCATHLSRLSAALATAQEQGAELKAIGERMRTQDNRCTAWPMYVVQQKRRIYGIDPDYGGEVVWIDGCNDHREADAEEFKQLESDYDESGIEPDGWCRTSFIDIWEHVTTCFTEDGANAYIKVNGHNLKHPRVYVESAWRNEEWQTVAKSLTGASPS